MKTTTCAAAAVVRPPPTDATWRRARCPRRRSRPSPAAQRETRPGRLVRGVDRVHPPTLSWRCAHNGSDKRAHKGSGRRAHKGSGRRAHRGSEMTRPLWQRCDTMMRAHRGSGRRAHRGSGRRAHRGSEGTRPMWQRWIHKIRARSGSENAPGAAATSGVRRGCAEEDSCPSVWYREQAARRRSGEVAPVAAATGRLSPTDTWCLQKRPLELFSNICRHADERLTGADLQHLPVGLLVLRGRTRARRLDSALLSSEAVLARQVKKRRVPTHYFEPPVSEATPERELARRE